MEEYKNFLNLDVVWKDEYMLELEITVSNNGYSGVSRGYDTGEHLQILAEKLQGFPKDDQSIFYEIGQSLGQGILSISFCPITPSGLVGVKVHLEKEGPINCQNSKVFTELLVEPNSIDTFQKYLGTLAANQQGIAKLIAR
ncbi:hypothetical protein ACQ86N_39110 [Puia sp. P3]|uniref:hypothetical protein n=1 Tax=Puia sp. P3 TaxID=3423952 RepID=UPI003D67B339